MKQTREFYVKEMRELSGPISEIQEYLAKLVAEHGEGLTIWVSGNDDYVDFQLYQKREETELEYEARLNQEKRQAAYKEKYEREQYEALKKKYG